MVYGGQRRVRCVVLMRMVARRALAGHAAVAAVPWYKGVVRHARGARATVRGGAAVDSVLQVCAVGAGPVEDSAHLR